MNAKQRQLDFLNREEEIEKKRKVEVERRKPTASEIIINNNNNKPKRKNTAGKARKILLFLVREGYGKKFTAEQISGATNTQFDGALFSHLDQEKRIEIENGHFFSFKPLKSVDSKNKLEELLTTGREPVRIEDLHGSYDGWQEDLETLCSQRKVIKIQADDTKMDVLYPNNSDFDMGISDETKEIWRKIKIPDIVAFESEMVRAQLYVGREEQTDAMKPMQKQPKKKQPRRKLAKMTNTHLDPSLIFNDDRQQ